MSEIDPDTWPLAETWEDCARHVEAGGVVEMYGPFDEWTKCPCSPEHYRAAADRPGQEYQYPRRLVPIPAPADPEAWPVVIDTEANPIGVQVTTDIPAPAPESSPDGEEGCVHAIAWRDGQARIEWLEARIEEADAERTKLRHRLAAWPEVPDDGVPRPIDVTLIEDEQARGWVNFHPENFCHRCGSRNPSWFAGSETFNAAMGVHAEHKWNGIICIACLAELHAAATGEDSTWQVSRAGSARSWPEVPDGHEVLVVPSEVVDEFAAGDWDTISGHHVATAARAAVDRRPKPEPRVPETERVPWWEARGRTEPAGNVIEQVGSDEDGPYICTIANGTRLRSLVDFDFVTVLAEDGES